MGLDGAREARTLGHLAPVITVNSSSDDHVVGESSWERHGGGKGLDEMFCFGLKLGCSRLGSRDRSRECEGAA